VDEVPGFARSVEYRRLDAEERESASFVFAALAEYLLNAGAASLSRASEILEEGATSDDEELHNYLVTEMFETWNSCDAPTAQRMRRALGLHARGLYDRWMNIVVPKA
jgi:hypothetical protein